MRRHLDEIQHLLMLDHGVLRVDRHPYLRPALERMVARGELVRAAPGLVVIPSMLGNVETTLRIIRWWKPGSVLLGRAALARNGFPALPLDQVWVASAARTRVRVPGLTMTRTDFPESLVVDRRGELMLTRPAAALWCASRDDWDPLCLTLRKGGVTPADLSRCAHLAPRSEAVAWRAVALRARDNPWSVAELELHDHFRAGGIIGWEGNPKLVMDGKTYFPDVRFRASRTIVEVDSEAHHSSEKERRDGDIRRNVFTAHGWRVLNLAPRAIRADPESALDQIRSMLHRREMSGPPGFGGIVTPTRRPESRHRSSR